ncbi:MAG TPA: hypothetical protein VFQ61_36035 [Polyangiaceae bacterium]|nr:hypothetical protein [Polyangiaceae bacterium]
MTNSGSVGENSGALSGSGGESEVRKEFGTFATLETSQGASTYLLSSQITYQLDKVGRRFKLNVYQGRGSFIDGIDLGPLHFRNRDTWESEIGAGGSIRVSGILSWIDGAQREAAVKLVMRATILENADLAYVTTVISGGPAGDQAATDLHIQMPASW